ncbi:hypothetical protein RHSIM_Rhsim01G0163100 [Rhododendron simsii]|uniref:DYW domain-containing protein n=1 Tax=Rhododendron simsii TaxID=118357 RepID=A0A834LXR4_RHOSS|nr:hypothetical protein RHSIM_Rhsim01G0163100 [Rhododendron simsii]
MLGFGVRPDNHIFPSTLKASGMLSWREFGKSVHCLALKIGFDGDVFVGSSVVDMYAKCGEIRDARTVFDGMPVRNVVSWGGMICGYTQLGEDEEALRLFKQALWEGLDVNDFTFSSVIRVCGNSTLLELGKQIHSLCLKTSYDSSSFVGSSLVSLYSKCGVIEGAYQVFEEIPERNLGMWNAMLIACAQHAHIEKVFDLFKQMESVCMKPNFITFLCVLYACSHAGLVEEGKHYFELMKVYGIEPGDQHYASMVDLLGRAGRLQDAVSFINGMPIKPTESVWGALLTGCRIRKDTKLAVYAADRVFELDQVSSGMNVLLANGYAAIGRYEDAAKARKMLRDRGVKKETGLSWVEQGNYVHTFAAGDRCHPISGEIYLKLKELGEEMECAGYVADTSFVLREVGSDEKNQAIRYHSERLAIAFGLITFPPERPIRVMKNLRVCGDCHTAIKFMLIQVFDISDDKSPPTSVLDLLAGLACIEFNRGEYGGIVQGWGQIIWEELSKEFFKGIGFWNCNLGKSPRGDMADEGDDSDGWDEAPPATVGVRHHGYCLRSLSYVSSLWDAASDSTYHVMGHFGLWFVPAANGSMLTAVVVIFGVSVYSHVDDAFKPEEIKAIMNDFAEPGTLAPTGLYFGGTKYTVINPRRSRGCHKRKEGNYEALRADEALRHYFFHALTQGLGSSLGSTSGSGYVYSTRKSASTYALMAIRGLYSVKLAKSY